MSPPDRPRRGKSWMIVFWALIAFLLLMWFAPDLL